MWVTVAGGIHVYHVVGYMYNTCTLKITLCAYHALLRESCAHSNTTVAPGILQEEFPDGDEQLCSGGQCRAGGGGEQHHTSAEKLPEKKKMGANTCACASVKVK